MELKTSTNNFLKFRIDDNNLLILFSCNEKIKTFIKIIKFYYFKYLNFKTNEKNIILPFYVFYKIILIYSKILKFFGFNDYLKYSNLFLNHIFQITNSIKINNKKSFNMTLHTPELRTLGRLNSIFTKSPITMNWLNKLDKETILYDFGSNIGLYSIYHCILNDGYSYSFEAHHLNLFNQIQNINKNNLQNKIKIMPNFFFKY